MDQTQPYLRRHWKLVVNVITFAALFLLIYLTRHQISDTFSNLHHLYIWALALLIPIEIINYHAQAKIYQRLFEIVGNRVNYRFLYQASLELNFVNHVFPSGGVTGLSYFTLRLRKGRELSPGKATFIHVTKIGMYVTAYEILLIIGVFALALKGHANNLVILAAGSLSTLLVVGTLIFVYIIGSKSRIDSFFTAMTKLLNRLIKLVRPSHPETISIDSARGLFDDFHTTYQEVKSKSSKLKAPMLYSLLADLTEILAVYVVYMAFDTYVNIGAVILAYGIANFAGLISIVPGGFGVYEGLMTAALASTGIPPGTSLPVTVTYRLLNTFLQVPPGYYLYQRTIKRGGEPPVERIEPNGST